MKTTKEMIEVMKAFAYENKSIQFKGYNSDIWADCDNKPMWIWNTYDYRVKPEPKKRPMTCQEVLDKFKEQGLMAVIHKRNGKVQVVSEIDMDENKITIIDVINDFESDSGIVKTLSYSILTPKQMEDNYTFLDGSGFMIEIK